MSKPGDRGGGGGKAASIAVYLARYRFSEFAVSVPGVMAQIARFEVAHGPVCTVVWLFWSAPTDPYRLIEAITPKLREGESVALGSRAWGPVSRSQGREMH